MRLIYNIFLVLLLVIGLSSPSSAAGVSSEVRRANRLYEKGDFQSASEHYQKALGHKPQSPPVEYDLGTALYKQGEYGQAVDHLNKALLTDDKNLQAKTHFNLANTFYKSGIRQKDKDIDKAIETVGKALPLYQKVLAADPKDEDAKFNYDFVQKELQKLKQQKQQQQQQNQQQQNQKSEDQQNKQNQQQSQDKSSQEKKSSGGGQSQQNGSDQNQEKSGTDNNPSQPQESDNAQDKPDQSGNQKQSEKQNKKPNGQGSSKPSEPSDRNEQGAPSQDTSGQMTKEEANMVMGDYERNEEPKGMLYFVPGKSKEEAAFKDW